MEVLIMEEGRSYNQPENSSSELHPPPHPEAAPEPRDILVSVLPSSVGCLLHLWRGSEQDQVPYKTQRTR